MNRLTIYLEYLAIATNIIDSAEAMKVESTID